MDHSMFHKYVFIRIISNIDVILVVTDPNITTYLTDIKETRQYET
jgi:hypothetical protein